MSSAFAPGRVELLGNHTDYNEGVVLSAALDLGITATGDRREDGKVVVTSAEMDGIVEADLASLSPTKSWADYPLGVTKMLDEAHQKLGGFQAHFSSTLPTGSGTLELGVDRGGDGCFAEEALRIRNRAARPGEDLPTGGE